MTPPLEPPPYRSKWCTPDGYLTSEAQRWLQRVYELLGNGSGTIAAAAEALDGEVTHENLPIGLDPTASNDAIAEAVDVDAASCNVVVHGGAAGSYDTEWNTYRNGAVANANIPAQSFTGLAYATTYYIRYDVVTEDWDISTAQANVLGSNRVVFTARTADSLGVMGDKQDGGGGSADGGRGGSVAGGLAGYGRVGL
jgi:hypothetical protein